MRLKWTLSVVVFAMALLAAPAVASACVETGSDEFDGGALDTGKWNLGAYPNNVAGITVSAGSLNVPFGSDGIEAQWNGGVMGYVAQPLPEGDEWTVEIKQTADILNATASGNNAGYGQAGLLIYQGDDNYMRLGHTRVGNFETNGAPGGDGTFFQFSREDFGGYAEAPGGTGVTLGERLLQTSGGLGNPAVTWMKLERDGDLITAWIATADPTSNPANWQQVEGNGALVSRYLPGATDKYIGVFTGNSGASWAPAFDYFRITCPGEPDVTAPTVSHDLSGETNSNGDYIETATLAINAVDNEGGSGVASTEINVNGSGWVPYEEPVTFNELGGYSVEYRATDNAENVSTVGTANFSVVGPGEPKLANKAAKKKVKLKAKKKSGNVAVTVSNTGSAAQSGVKVCATAPKAKIKVTGKKCVTVGNLNAGQKKKVKFKFKTTKKLVGKKAKVTVKATAPGQSTKTAKITVQQAKK